MLGNKKKIIKNTVIPATLVVGMFFSCSFCFQKDEGNIHSLISEDYIEKVEEYVDTIDAEGNNEHIQENESSPEDKSDVIEKVENDEQEDSDIELSLLDIEQFESILVDKFGNIEAYDIIDGKFYLYATKNELTTLWEFQLDDNAGMENVEQLNILVNNLGNQKEVCSFGKSENYIEYNEKKFCLDGIKGKNVFSEKVGISSSKSITSVVFNKSNEKINVEVAVVKNNKTYLFEYEYETDNSSFDINEFLQIEQAKNNYSIDIGLDTNKIQTFKVEEIETGKEK